MVSDRSDSYECKLRLPRNTFLEGLKGDQADTIVSNLSTCLLHWSTRCLNVHAALQKRQSELGKDTVKQAKEAHEAIVRLYGKFDTSKAIVDLRSQVINQHASEPTSGTCDAVMVTSIPIPKNIRTAKAVAAYNRSRVIVANYKPARVLQEIVSRQPGSHAPADDTLRGEFSAAFKADSEVKIEGNGEGGSQVKGNVQGENNGKGELANIQAKQAHRQGEARGVSQARQGTKMPQPASEDGSGTQARAGREGRGGTKIGGGDGTKTATGTRTGTGGESERGGETGAGVKNAQKPLAPLKFPLYEFPLSVHSGDYPPYNPALETSAPTVQWILLPQLFAEYKKPEDDEIKALNQARFYCVSGAAYLDTVGIREYPVYSLAAHGTLAALIMGWKSNDGVSLNLCI